MRAGTAALLVALVGVGWCGAVRSAPASHPKEADALCRTLARAVDLAAPGGPTFVVSYLPGPNEAALPGALATSAFSYDNALAAIAFVACGEISRARRIADAFISATRRDRTFKDGRIRNAYRAGAVGPGPVALPGWWDSGANRWDEDAYQDGTSTGNVAWVALALLNVHAATAEAAYLTTASELLGWIRAHGSDAPGPPGYAGGVTGFDGAQSALAWKSTEHNIDVAAAAGWVNGLSGNASEAAMANRAKSFVASRFRPQPGFFLLGTRPDGADDDPSQLALDVQLWPILGVPNAPAAWRRALGFADAHLRRGDGMTFAGIGPNRWTEGTAQAALAFRAAGADHVADAFLAGVPAHASPSGLLYATSAGEVPTGLLVESPGGGQFNYYHRPHLGATAWATLAATRWNPFTGRKLD